MYKAFGKRFFDFTFAIFGFVFLSPLFVIIYLVLWIAHKGNPIFQQARPGKNEKIFHILKFKTMTDEVDENGKLLPDSQRLTPIGSFVRKTSMDEIPQLLNVIKGDMSFIGPRPLLVKYIPHYTEKEKERHLVRPGITGLAQVSGRNMLSWEDKFQKDCEYVDKYSFSMDLKIAIKTIQKILASKDILVNPESLHDPLDVERNRER